MRRVLPWVIVCLAAAGIDLGVRFGLRPEFQTSLWIEGGVFLLSAGVLLGLYRRAPARPGWRRELQVILVAAFALGGLRSLIWAAGNPVTQANLKILLIGLLGLAYRKRRLRNAALSEDESGRP